MSQLIIVNRSQLLAAANGDNRRGVSSRSHRPRRRTRCLPPCPRMQPVGLSWGFTLKQTNGDLVRFNSTGPVASGQAEATTPTASSTGTSRGQHPGRQTRLHLRLERRPKGGRSASIRRRG